MPTSCRCSSTKQLTIDILSVLAPGGSHRPLQARTCCRWRRRSHQAGAECARWTRKPSATTISSSRLGIPIYGKSLLYLISRAFEPERKTPILGLEQTLQDDADMLEFFSGGGGSARVVARDRQATQPELHRQARTAASTTTTPTMRTVAGLIRADGTQPAAPFPGGDGLRTGARASRQADALAMMAGASRPPGRAGRRRRALRRRERHPAGVVRGHRSLHHQPARRLRPRRPQLGWRARVAGVRR